MESTDNKTSSLTWILAILFTGGMIFLLFWLPESFWVLLPFSGTYLAKAFKVI
jgi:hypothetical protein